MKEDAGRDAEVREERMRRRIDDDFREYDRELELQERGAGQVLKRAGSRTLAGFAGFRGIGQLLASVGAAAASAVALGSRVAAGPLSMEGMAAVAGGTAIGLAAVAAFRAARDFCSPPEQDAGFRLPLGGEAFARVCTGPDSPAERLAKGADLKWAERRTAELHLGEICRKLKAEPERILSQEAAAAAEKAPMDFDAGDARAILDAAGREGADAAAHAWDGRKIAWDPMRGDSVLLTARVPAGTGLAAGSSDSEEVGAAMLAAAACACIASDMSTPQGPQA